MCVIVAKQKGATLPTKEILKNCFENNSDGCGFMYESKGHVIIHKGFMNFNEFYKSVKRAYKTKNLKDKNLVMHFRIGTSGGIKVTTTHPFPVTNDTNELEKLQTTCDLGMVHNGIISDYAYKDNKFSDTQNYIRDFVYPLYNLNKKFLSHASIVKILEKSSGSKLCFLDKDDNLTLVGDFIEENGVYYSNDSYSYKNTWTYNYNKNFKYDYYDDYYDEDYYKYNYGTDYKDTKEPYDIEIHKDYVELLDNNDFYVGDYSPTPTRCDEDLFMTSDNSIYMITRYKDDFVQGILVDTNCEIYTEEELNELGVLVDKESE